MKSLFNDEEPKPLSKEKIHMIKENSGIPSLLPEELDERVKEYNQEKIEDSLLLKEVNTNPYSDNPPQVFIDGKKIPEGMQASGSFFIRGEELFADIRLEFNVRHPKYSEYFKKLKILVKEAQKDHVLLSSSGI